MGHPDLCGLPAFGPDYRHQQTDRDSGGAAGLLQGLQVRDAARGVLRPRRAQDDAVKKSGSGWSALVITPADPPCASPTSRNGREKWGTQHLSCLCAFVPLLGGRGLMVGQGWSWRLLARGASLRSVGRARRPSPRGCYPTGAPSRRKAPPCLSKERRGQGRGTLESNLAGAGWAQGQVDSGKLQMPSSRACETAVKPPKPPNFTEPAQRKGKINPSPMSQLPSPMCYS
jgi:hypothetical protein